MEKIEGIVVKQTPFQDDEKIISIFSKEKGLTQCICKRISPKNLEKVNLTSLLCLGEFHLSGKSQGLKRFVDGSIINMHLPLREDCNKFSCSMQMIQLILQTQMDERKAPLLYQLFKVYLKHICIMDYTPVFLLSFTLKLLHYEGLLSPLNACCECNSPHLVYFHEGGGFCIDCKPSYATLWDKAIWDLALKSLNIKDFSEFQLIENEEKEINFILSKLNYFN